MNFASPPSTVRSQAALPVCPQETSSIVGSVHSMTLANSMAFFT